MSGYRSLFNFPQFPEAFENVLSKKGPSRVNSHAVDLLQKFLWLFRSSECTVQKSKSKTTAFRGMELIFQS